MRQEAKRSLTAAAVVALLAVVIWWYRLHEPGPAVRSDLAVVLPVKVTPNDAEHAWIRLGAMDYIASRLRRYGEMAVLPSEQILRLANDPAHAVGTTEFVNHVRATTGAHWVLQPSAVQEADGWRVRLLIGEGDDHYEIDGQAETLLKAAAVASDVALRRLGRDASSAPAPTELTERLQRVDAGLLSGQLANARSVIHAAPPPQRKDPELRVREGQLEFSAGRLRAASTLFAALLDDSSELSTEVRARALMGLGAVALREGDFAGAERRYSEALEALEGDAGSRQEPALLGNAYNGRGVSRVEQGRAEDGIADLGRARIAMERAGDEVGAASVAGHLGMLEARRGNVNRALREFEQAIAVFERFGVRESLAAILQARARTELQQLRAGEALEDSRRAVELGEQLDNPQLLQNIRQAYVESLLFAGLLDQAESELQRNDLGEPALSLRLLLERGRFEEAMVLAARQRSRSGALEGEVLVLSVQAAAQARNAGDGAMWPNAAPPDADAAGTDFEHSFAAALAAKASADTVGEADRLFRSAVDLAIEQRSLIDEARAGAAYVIYLVGAGENDRAAEWMGHLKPYADRDYRVARAALALYQALGDASSQTRAQTQVQRLAGQRDTNLPVIF